MPFFTSFSKFLKEFRKKKTLKEKNNLVNSLSTAEKEKIAQKAIEVMNKMKKK